MSKKFDWLRTQKEKLLARKGGETFEGCQYGGSRSTSGHSQSSVKGPESVVRLGKNNDRSRFLGRMRKVLAAEDDIPSTKDLPVFLAQEIESGGGPAKWALSQPGTSEKIARIRRRRNSKKPYNS